MKQNDTLSQAKHHSSTQFLRDHLLRNVSVYFLVSELLPELEDVGDDEDEDGFFLKVM